MIPARLMQIYLFTLIVTMRTNTHEHWLLKKGHEIDCHKSLFATECGLESPIIKQHNRKIKYAIQYYRYYSHDGYGTCVMLCSEDTKRQ